MFEYEKVNGASFYIVQLIEDTTGASFNHYLVQQKDSSTATLISNLKFGKKYQWRYAGIKPGQTPVWKGPYHFAISNNALLDSNLVRFIITQNDTQASAGGLIVNDCTHTIIDRTGKLVWYLDKVDWRVLLKKKNLELKPQILDLRLTPYGTVTYLADSVPIECDLSGNMLWKAPNDGKVSGSSSELYNHDFKRLPNGHYMVLGNELWRKLPRYRDTVAIHAKYTVRKLINGKEFAQVEFGTVIEYDKNGKVVWSWNSESYLDSDALKPRTLTPQNDWELKAHINAASVDAQNKYVYVGFRNISRIVKIEKKSGKVVDSWGLQLPSGGAREQALFHQQHDANILDDGTLAVYNNNDYPGSDSFSRVVVFSTRQADDGQVMWSFDCNFDSLDRHASRSGGNVDRLKNGNYFVCMGNMNRIFEVTKDKKIVWQGAIKVNGKTGDIYFHRLYRAHCISSLYPCYFSFQTDRDSIKESNLSFSFKIFNKGSENDSYQVKISTVKGTFTKQFTTAIIDANRSATFEVKPDKPLAAGDRLQITISSKTNPDFERKNEVVVVK